MDGTAHIEMTNPTSLSFKYNISLSMSSRAAVKPLDPHSGSLDPGETALHKFSVRCPSAGETRAFSAPLINVDYTVTAKHTEGRISSRTPVDLNVALPPTLPKESTRNRALILDGETVTVRIPFTEALNVTGPFTIEAWFRVESFSYVGGGLARMPHQVWSGYALCFGEEQELHETGDGKPTLRFVVSDAETKELFEAKSDRRQPPMRQWIHIACTYDGTTIAVWLNGTKTASSVAPKAIRPNEHPMYLGADLGWNGDPWAFTEGLIDEFRFSTTCRYNKSFKPGTRFRSDADTLILYHFDRIYANRVLDYSGNEIHATLLGNAALTDK
jgi:hypothetical protein